ncbi:threonine ammonia-lyase [Lentzea flaviverrucosa]|uniref:threonine ammonia-lyase n=1 Tax=Lentzea flaviverrucosa TaxID=200379 RepID=A0A1H9LKR2_9PSEU|nr:threonine/serine dehydratase [Lentzea flaviverrucosa]RDI31273.1 threonine dehydratase [Lentzea flaviverrucosa]SER12010.1 threonine dehydratase [Lentzea flaviverrucosa]
MRLVTLEDVHAAAAAIAPHVVHTPLLSFDSGLWIKPESLQPVGAFKLRGAVNALSRIPSEDRARGVVAYSSGNHAQAVAYAAKTLGMPAAIVVPENTPQLKIDATRAHGAEVFVVGITERESRAYELVEERKATLIPPFDHPDVIAGQGTIGLEICADLPDVATVLVPVSGGGLVSGVAAAVKSLRPNVRVIGVEPELAGDTTASFAAGELVRWDAHDRARTVADGLRAEPSELTWAHIRQYVDDVVTVSEDEIREAVRQIARRTRIVSETSGAVAVAAYLNRELPAGPAVAVVSGGNIEPEQLASILG